MAKYRQLHTEFWSDGFILDLTPEEKYFYLYLMTNAKTTQCGIYELPKKFMQVETGYKEETLDKLLNKFEEYGKIKYCSETKEVMIINWIKYNEPNNQNSIKCVNKELKSVKHRKFLSIFYKQCCDLKLETDKLFQGMEDVFQLNEPPVEDLQGACSENQNINKPLTRGLQGAYKGLGSNKVISNNQEVINNNQEVINNNQEIPVAEFKDVIKAFQDNIHLATPMESEKLVDWCKDLSCSVVIRAIEQGVKYNARNMRYIEQIINTWKTSGIKNSADVTRYIVQWDEKNRGKKQSKKGKEVVTSWDYNGQRKYDYDDLEKKLLGWN